MECVSICSKIHDHIVRELVLNKVMIISRYIGNTSYEVDTIN